MMENQATRGARMLKESGYHDGPGYAKGGDVKQVKKLIRKGFKEHENAEHGGKHEVLKLKRGGAVKGEASEDRPDRRARGGKVGAVAINIHSGDPAKEKMAQQQGMQQGMQVGAKLGARAMAQKMAGAGGPPHPPMAPPAGPMGAAPPMMGGGPGAPGAGMPPGGGPLARGGEVKVRGHVRRKAGGRIGDCE